VIRVSVFAGIKKQRLFQINVACFILASLRFIPQWKVIVLSAISPTILVDTPTIAKSAGIPIV
jgi:hypothetical protein